MSRFLVFGPVQVLSFPFLPLVFADFTGFVVYLQAVNLKVLFK